MNQTQSPLVFPSFNLGVQQLPLVAVDGKVLQQPVMPLTYTMPLEGYTPCVVDSTGNFVPLQQTVQPVMPISTVLLSPPACVATSVSPSASPLVGPVPSPTLSLESMYDLSEPLGRESTPYSTCSDETETVFEDEFSTPVVETRSFTQEPKTKEQIVPEKLAIIENMFADRYDECGMRGSDIARIKVKTISALNSIVELLSYLSEHVNIIHVSCPKSTKKKGQSVRGFICYLKVAECDLERLEQLFNLFNLNEAFHPIDVNPQKKM